jgi:hypothetical protein
MPIQASRRDRSNRKRRPNRAPFSSPLSFRAYAQQPQGQQSLEQPGHSQLSRTAPPGQKACQRRLSNVSPRKPTGQRRHFWFAGRSPDRIWLLASLKDSAICTDAPSIRTTLRAVALSHTGRFPGKGPDVHNESASTLDPGTLCDVHHSLRVTHDRPCLLLASHFTYAA